MSELNENGRRKQEAVSLIDFGQNKDNPELVRKASDIAEKLQKDANFCKISASWNSQKEIIARKRSVYSLVESVRKAFGMQDTKKDIDNFTLPVEMSHLADDAKGIMALVITAMAYKEALLAPEKNSYSDMEMRKAYCVLYSKALSGQIMQLLEPFMEKASRKASLNVAELASVRALAENTGHFAGKA